MASNKRREPKEPGKRQAKRTAAGTGLPKPQSTGKPAGKPKPVAKPAGKPKPVAKPAGKPSASAASTSRAKPSSRKPPAPQAAPSAEGSRLAALLDGVLLGEEDTRALWSAFSYHLDEYPGDFQGFAEQQGFKSVRPEHRQGRAFLICER